MNRKMIPAIGGAIPYGHSTAVRYAASPRIFWVASAATRRPAPSPIAVTPNAKRNEFTVDEEYSDEVRSLRKFSRPTKKLLSPKGDVRKTLRRTDSSAGQKK